MKGPVEFSVLGASTGHGTGQLYLPGKSQCPKLRFSNPILRHLFRLGLSVKGRIPGICFQTIWGSTPGTRRRIDFQMLFREAIQRRLRSTSVKPMARIMRLVSVADGRRLLTFGILQDIMRRAFEDVRGGSDCTNRNHVAGGVRARGLTNNERDFRVTRNNSVSKSEDQNLESISVHQPGHYA